MPTYTSHIVSTPSLTSLTPILTGYLTNSAELSASLQKAIIQSGLFYESHQAQWINGKNTLENLQQEPQGKLMPALADLPIHICASSKHFFNAAAVKCP